MEPPILFSKLDDVAIVIDLDNIQSVIDEITEVRHERKMYPRYTTELDVSGTIRVTVDGASYGTGMINCYTANYAGIPETLFIRIDNSDADHPTRTAFACVQNNPYTDDPLMVLDRFVFTDDERELTVWDLGVAFGLIPPAPAG